ncbi:uncharacterized protein I303_101269 [Kwoniella dejecticola CBS 10117]|uniref:Uncharacterized protein n=1 Tax=Kwoniella dejecticola CBS 10117 TaxID=1296121 RepID=A0A1A6AHA9_9TREE|nr:uncharacterized protein I303_01276 [Kwoniella dejecticola CBS 10117]OBR89449.1 hypothetical protein I303_01276 [Kwoniella dejecticola CBS 10117]
MSDDREKKKFPLPPGVGAGKPDHPFAVTVEDPIPNAIIPDGYGIKYHAYHTILPAGTSLPGGAVLPMSSVADFPMVLPMGTKLPGGVMVPIVMQKVEKGSAAPSDPPGPICTIQ